MINNWDLYKTICEFQGAAEDGEEDKFLLRDKLFVTALYKYNMILVPKAFTRWTTDSLIDIFIGTFISLFSWFRVFLSNINITYFSGFYSGKFISNLLAIIP